MKNRIGYINNNNEEIFKIDLSNLSGKKLLDHVLFAVVLLEKINQPTTFYIDIRSCKLNMESLSYLRIIGKKIQPYVNKSGVIGVSSHIKPFFNLYLKYTKSNIKPFENEVEIKEYLSIDD